MVLLIFLIKIFCLLKVVRCSYNIIRANEDRIRYSDIIMSNENLVVQDGVIIAVAYDKAKYRMFINSIIIIICLSIIF